MNAPFAEPQGDITAESQGDVAAETTQRPRARSARRASGNSSQRAVLDSPGAVVRGMGRFSQLTRPGGSWVPDGVITECRRAWRRLDGDTEVASVAVTSSLRREGRTTVAVGLALARRDLLSRKSILVELDLVNRSFAANAWSHPSPGVAEVLRGEAPLVDCIEWVAEGLGVLPAGDPGDEGAALLTPPAVSQLLSGLRAFSDFVIADLPPLPPAGVADTVADLFGSVVLVVRAGATPMSVVSQAAETLETPPAVVLNGTASALPRWLRRRHIGA